MRYELGPGDVAVERRGEPGGRPALLLPGQNFPADLPPLHYTTRTLLARGWTVHEVWWRSPEVGVTEWGLRQAARLVRETRPDLVVGKSLGSLGLPAAVEAGCAGAWLTPLLHRPELAALRLDGRHLLVGGTADPSWDSAVAAGSGAEVLELPGADHALAVADVAASIALVAEVQRRVDAFLTALDA